MKLRSVHLLFVLFIPVMSFAQSDRQYPMGRKSIAHECSALSVFSENGEQFFLVMNGVNQNNQPQSKIRVEGLPGYGNDVQVIFADNRTPAIRRKINIADPVDGKEVNMVLKIVRDRDGRAKLKFHKCTEIDRGYRAPRDEYVMNYGKPQRINTVTETTYTDPNTGELVTQTTTTTTNDNGYGRDKGHNWHQSTPPPPPPPPAPVAMDPQTFNDVKRSIADGSFEDTKLSTAKTILSSNYISTNQVMEICRLFSFENTKMAFAKFAFGKTVDQNNYYKVGSVFNFDSDKKVLNDFISNGGR